MEALSRTVRFAVPEWLVAMVQSVLTLVAMIVVCPPPAAVAALVSVPILFVSTRRYLRRAPARLHARARQLRDVVGHRRRDRRGRPHR